MNRQIAKNIYNYTRLQSPSKDVRTTSVPFASSSLTLSKNNFSLAGSSFPFRPDAREHSISHRCSNGISPKAIYSIVKGGRASERAAGQFARETRSGSTQLDGTRTKHTLHAQFRPHFLSYKDRFPPPKCA